MQILIVEDERNLAEALRNILEEQKWQTTLAFHGEDGCNYACSGQFDIIILDVMLPHKDGFSIVKEMREKKIDTPVLMLTAKDDIQDKVHGLDMGADDYMTKPFSSVELLARIRALTRRKGEVMLEVLQFHDVTLQLSTCELQCGTRSVHIAYKEFEIMKLLMKHPKMITSKEDLIMQVWGADSEAVDNNVEAYISFLRKKLQYLKSETRIRVIRKVGYHLEVAHDS